MSNMCKPRKCIVNAALVGLGAMLLVACEKQNELPTHQPQDRIETPNMNIDLWPSLAKPADPALEQRIDSLLAQMSLAEKVGQMTQAEIGFVQPEDVKRLHLGSILNGGDSFVNNDRDASISDWVDYMDKIYAASMDDSDGKIAIPITYGTDAVHGNSKFGYATIFPHNIGLGAAHNPELMKRIGEITALEVLIPGIDWTFAPTLAVVRDDRWGRTYESYSEDPEIVKSYAKQLVEGLQGQLGSESFMGVDRVYGTAKHWVGDGGTTNGVDQGDNAMSEEDLIKLQASAYFPAIEAGVQSIMISHSSWHGERLHGHKYLITDVLKNQLGFDGFVIGDWNAHGRVPGCSNDSCPQAINAGLDMLMVTEDYEAFINNTIKQVEQGVIPLARIDDAVRRILRVKIRSGLFVKGTPSSRTFAGKAELMGSEQHRKVAAQAVRESLVLLKNNEQTLPLNPKSHILVTGDGAHDIAKQAGAWTINWQGQGNKNEDFPGASSIYDGIREQVEQAGGSVELSKNGTFKSKPDAAVVVFGENPYAEWQGDLRSIAYKPYTDQDYELLKGLQSQGIAVVGVFITGRPLWINRELNASDAFVVAWLPGSEGSAVADVILAKPDGSVNHDFKGKLSFSWPKKASQTVLNVGDDNYDPLFAYGFGLDYKNDVNLPILDEENDYQPPADTNAPYEIFTRGLSENWQLFFDTGKGPEFLGPDLRASNEFVTIREADKLVQGDSFEFQVSGATKTTIGISSPGYRVGTGAYLDQGGVLSFDVRTIAAPEGALTAVMRCPQGYCGHFDITNLVPPAGNGEWATITIPLSCFANEGMEFELNNMPFALQSDGAVSLRITNVFYSFEPVATASITCE